MNWENALHKRVETTRLLLVRFRDNEWGAIGDTRRGHSEFTIVRPHGQFDAIKAPMPCLIIGGETKKADVYVGLLSSKAPVATLESRVKIKRCSGINVLVEELLDFIPAGRDRTLAQNRFLKTETVSVLPPKASQCLVKSLTADDRSRLAMRLVGEAFLSTAKYSNPLALQCDGIHMALKAFGLNAQSPVSLLNISTEDTGLSQLSLLEDSVVEHDARVVPGFDLIGSEPTGRAIFSRPGERLEVYTANKRPLEQVFGVDLIYYNVISHSIVMLQYKMLNKEDRRDSEDGWEWVYRPDKSILSELERMNRFSISEDEPDAYRLSEQPFFLKFVKRDAAIGSFGYLVSLDHFCALLNDSRCKGPRGGVVISFDSQRIKCLHEYGFLDLLRSGYIGSRGSTTDHFKVLIDQVISNNRSVVAAIQSSTSD